MRAGTRSFLRSTFSLFHRLCPFSPSVAHAPPIFLKDLADGLLPIENGLDDAKLAQARDYALTAEGSGCIIHRGRLVMQWGDQSALYDLKSSSKAIGVTVLGLALKDGLVKLDDPAKKFHPTFGTPPESNAETGWLAKITLRHLATQTAGFEKPGGYEKLVFAPGTAWLYSDGGPNWLAECLTLVYRRDLNDVLFERVFTPLGITPADIKWRKHAYRPDLIDGLKRREFGSGFSANVQAMARLGYLYLREGWWNGELILPHGFIEAVRVTSPEVKRLETRDAATHGSASQHYGLLWWNNNDGTIAGLPRDAYWSWGLYDSLIVVVPSLDLVVARTGKSWKRAPDGEHYDPLKPFLEPIAAAVKSKDAASGAPLPPSPVIAEVRWAPKESIVHLARGSDNWPITWGDDDALYTAYGDGHGFEPFVPKKLSVGFAKVLGDAASPHGINLPSPTLDSLGDGKQGRKASGIVMVDGTLYLLARNVGNAQLAWSTDHGATWTWADWKFTESFGCPTFVNFGRNYADARDEFVYLLSPDADSAYERADRVVLARVPKNSIRNRDAYEFFVQRGDDGQPIWSRDIKRRGAVFDATGQCYRLGVTYNAGLKRYLLCMTGAGNDTRFAGGFGIYDAPEPWGPWTTAFFTESWDVGPGESSSLPTKWMSADGMTVHLVFSGDDSFSVRRAELLLRSPSGTPK
jgi:CubicO group peptidase (beta-lactamase class C family)